MAALNGSLCLTEHHLALWGPGSPEPKHLWPNLGKSQSWHSSWHASHHYQHHRRPWAASCGCQPRSTCHFLVKATKEPVSLCPLSWGASFLPSKQLSALFCQGMCERGSSFLGSLMNPLVQAHTALELAVLKSIRKC